MKTRTKIPTNRITTAFITHVFIYCDCLSGIVSRLDLFMSTKTG